MIFMDIHVGGKIPDEPPPPHPPNRPSTVHKSGGGAPVLVHRPSGGARALCDAWRYRRAGVKGDPPAHPPFSKDRIQAAGAVAGAEAEARARRVRVRWVGERGGISSRWTPAGSGPPRPPALPAPGSCSNSGGWIAVRQSGQTKPRGSRRRHLVTTEMPI